MSIIKILGLKNKIASLKIYFVKSGESDAGQL